LAVSGENRDQEKSAEEFKTKNGFGKTEKRTPWWEGASRNDLNKKEKKMQANILHLFLRGESRKRTAPGNFGKRRVARQSELKLSDF